MSLNKSNKCVLLLRDYTEHVNHVEHLSTDQAAVLLLLFYPGKNQSKQEDLKEMGDISSGMSSSIMQIYLKQVLESFFHSQSTVRHFALSVITLTLSQGLIHPVQVCFTLAYSRQDINL